MTIAEHGCSFHLTISVWFLSSVGSHCAAAQFTYDLSFLPNSQLPSRNNHIFSQNVLLLCYIHYAIDLK